MFNLRDWCARQGTSRRRNRCPARLQVEALEERTLLSVTFTIDSQQNVQPISRFIYGVNQSLDGAYANNTFTLLVGNRWTAYNWEYNASNAGSDYIFQNDAYFGGDTTNRGAVDPTLQYTDSRI